MPVPPAVEPAVEDRGPARSEPRIRRATIDDSAMLAELAARTFTDAYAGTGVHAGDDARADLDRYVAQTFTEARIGEQLRAPGSTFLLAEIASDERPIGYVHLRSGATPSVAAADPVELVRLYLEQRVTGSGHGGVLLEAAIAAARAGGHDVLWLGVWERNVRAQRFYRRWGFTRVGEVTFVLGGDVQTDLIMSRPLTTPRPGSRR